MRIHRRLTSLVVALVAIAPAMVRAEVVDSGVPSAPATDELLAPTATAALDAGVAPAAVEVDAGASDAGAALTPPFREAAPEPLRPDVAPHALASEPSADAGTESAPEEAFDSHSATIAFRRDREELRLLPLIPPGVFGSPIQSVDALALSVPFALEDTRGVSLGGSSAPETVGLVQGFALGTPETLALHTPISTEFIEALEVSVAGNAPELARATGGLLSATLKRGTNIFKGALFGHFTPGVLSGVSPRIVPSASVVSSRAALWNMGDLGLELSGPILEDKLYFYAGVQPGVSRTRVQKSFGRYRGSLDANGVFTQEFDAKGRAIVDDLDNGTQNLFADQKSLQFVANLTYVISPTQTLELSALGNDRSSGGPGQVGTDFTTGEFDEITRGTLSAQSLLRRVSTQSLTLKYDGLFFDRSVEVHAGLGGTMGRDDVLPSDGSLPGQPTGLAATPRVVSNAAALHTLSDVERGVAAFGGCGGAESSQTCPLGEYAFGGPGEIRSADDTRISGFLSGTWKFERLGTHRLSAGLMFDRMESSATRAYSGGVVLTESADGSAFEQTHQLGRLVGVDAIERDVLDTSRTFSTLIGAFARDSWTVFDRATVNFGVRYDQQTLGSERVAANITTRNEIAPHVGLVYDFAGNGRSRVFFQYSRAFQTLPLGLLERRYPEASEVGAVRKTRATGSGAGCDPINQPADVTGNCLDNLSTDNFQALSDATNPNQTYRARGGAIGAAATLWGQSQDEFAVGGEYLLFEGAKAGVTYIRRQLVDVIDTVGLDESGAVFLANPGVGGAAALPTATRDYDGLTVSFSKSFSHGWLAFAAYTWSSLKGNYAGLGAAGNDTTAFDSPSGSVNQSGSLPLDVTHVLRLHGAKEFELSARWSLNLGLGYEGRSGASVSYLAASPNGTLDAVQLFARGSGGRLPWVHRIDARAGASVKLGTAQVLSFSLDLFNLFNFQSPISYDERFTTVAVRPSTGSPSTLCIASPTAACGAPLTRADGSLLKASDINPDFKRVTAYQAPLAVRFGARLDF